MCRTWLDEAKLYPQVGIQCCVDAAREVLFVVKAEADFSTQRQADGIEAILYTEVKNFLQGLEGQALTAAIGGLKSRPIDTCMRKLPYNVMQTACRQ